MVLAAGVGGAFWAWIGVGVGLLVDVHAELQVLCAIRDSNPEPAD
jgi:hypothetical protein